MKEIRIVELYAGQQRCCTVTPEEIFSAFSGSEPYFVERDWLVSCEYLAPFTGETGICRIDLLAELDGNTIDYAKTMAVFMLFAGLQKTGRMGMLPYQAAIHVVPYITARQSMAQIHMTRTKRLDEAVQHGLGTLRDFDGSTSVDDVLWEVLEALPPASRFSAVDAPDKGRYLPFFEMLAEKAEACADPGILEQIGAYLEALQ